MYVVWKTVNGYGPYAYVQESVSKNGKSTTKHVAYLGKLGDDADGYRVRLSPGRSFSLTGSKVVIPEVPEEVMAEVNVSPRARSARNLGTTALGERASTSLSAKPRKVTASKPKADTPKPDRHSIKVEKHLEQADGQNYANVYRNGFFVAKIDVDADGNITQEAALNRLLDVREGTRTSKKRSPAIDMAKRAGTIHDLESDDAFAWVVFPNESDVRGVDDSRKALERVPAPASTPEPALEAPDGKFLEPTTDESLPEMIFDDPPPGGWRPEDKVTSRLTPVMGVPMGLWQSDVVDGVRAEFYVAPGTDKRAAIRAVDEDSGEVIDTRLYGSMTDAMTYYVKWGADAGITPSSKREKLALNDPTPLAMEIPNPVATPASEPLTAFIDMVETDPVQEEVRDDDHRTARVPLATTDLRGTEGKAPPVPQGHPPRTDRGDDERGSGTRPGSDGAGVPEVRSQPRRTDPAVVAHGDPERDPGESDGLDQLATRSPGSPVRDFILTPAALGNQESPAQRFDANIAALRVLRTLREEDRPATPEEQAILAPYSGFGDSAFSQAFPTYGGANAIRDGIWKERHLALVDAVGEDEFRAIEKSRLNAFYTTPDVITAMWDGVARLGGGKLTHPRVLEPSSGSGRFLGLQPVEMAARSERTAVELDPSTGEVVKNLYPNTAVHIMGYQDAPIPDDSIDIAISNVPFGEYGVADRKFRKGARRLASAYIHNYFFAKTMDKLRPGGVMAFVTSHGTLDSKSHQRVREYLHEQGDLVGAIRLPKGAFPDTDVVTDIIYMRKRLPGEAPGDDSWVHSDATPFDFTEERWGETHTRQVEHNVNRYFAQHPEMVIGTQDASGTMNFASGQYSVTLDDMSELPVKLQRAIGTLPVDLISDVDRTSSAPRSVPTLSEMGRRSGETFKAEDGTLKVKKDGMIVSAGLSGTDASRVEGMLGIRDAARTVLSTQLVNGTDEEVATAQKALNERYDAFFKKYGDLASRANVTLLRSDPDASFIRALEKRPGKNERFTKAQDFKMPLFNERVIHGQVNAVPESASDALAVTLNQRGTLDFDHMGELVGNTGSEIRAKLAQDGAIYKNPVGDWELSSRYLTGDVRLKLSEAKAAAKATPSYQANVRALEAVQPDDIPPSKITVQVGTPWIPAGDFHEFMRHLVDVDRGGYDARSGQYIYSWSDELGSWVKPFSGRIKNASFSKNTIQWGTDAMPATEIIDRLLNSKPVDVSYKDDSGKTIKDGPKTAAAQEKARAIQEEYERWLWDDPERADRLSRLYNDKFNNLRPRVFDGSHQQFPGMTQKWFDQLHGHQKDAIWRVVEDGTALLAHEVGFGKTAVMVAAAMELRRLGLSRKNVMVVPKATHAQFLNQFREIYPGAKILFPEDEDFTPARRGEFMNRIATGDWDAVILADSQFTQMPIKPETERKFLQEQKDELLAAIEAEATTSNGKGPTHKQLQKKMEALEVRLTRTNQAIEERRDDQGAFFEDLGIDQMFVDESDSYKNLGFSTKMTRIKGLTPGSEAQKAWDMYSKVRWLQDNGNHRGVVFATGTPIANTIAELWTNMRYLQRPLLDEKGLQHFDAWASTFGGITDTVEQTPQGTYRTTQRFAKFQNIPELAQLWQQTADIRVASEVPEILERQPRLVGGKRQTIQASSTQALKDYMSDLGVRASQLGSVDPKEDNMLKISNDARMAGLDMRMVDPTATANPEGKISLAANNIAQIYRETRDQKGTQLVFLDLGTPKAKDKVKEDGTDGDDEENTVEEAKVLRNVYGLIRTQLVHQGVPDKEIAFIHEAKTNKARIALFQNVNDGAVRVLIGSTGKMGAGVNVQERAAALHHLDAPWRPRDIEQREGRIIRQGNRAYGPELDPKTNAVTAPGNGVQIFNYVTQGSFDGYMWQAIEAKAKAIKSMMKREVTSRTMDDVDELVLTASEAKALASGNPDVMRSVQLKNEIQRLHLIAGSYKDAQVRARHALAAAPGLTARYQADIATLKKDAAKVSATADAEFGFTVGTSSYDKRGDAGPALVKALVAVPASTEPEKAKQLGRYRGFSVRGYNGFEGFTLLVTSPETNETYATGSMAQEDVTPQGLLARIDNVLASIPARHKSKEQALEDLERNQVTYHEQASKPFTQQGDLDRMTTELLEVERRLKGDPEPEDDNRQNSRFSPSNSQGVRSSATSRKPSL